MANAINVRTEQDISMPPFVVDRASTVRDTGRQIDWDLLTPRYRRGAQMVKLAAAAAADATEVTVDPIEKPLRKGDVIQFGADEYITLTEAAAAGDTTLAVEAVTTALEDNDEGWVGGDGGYFIPAGTVMDLLANGKIVPAALGTGSVTAFGLLISNAEEDSRTDALTGYGVFRGGIFYENLLPEATGSPKVIDSTQKTELLARGGMWQFDQYSDDTV